MDIIKSQINDPKFIIYQASIFLLEGINYAHKELFSEEVKEKSISDLLPKLSFPATNISFGLELAFKAILLHNSQVIRGHKLDKLFEQLPITYQDEIIRAVELNNLYPHFKILNYSGDEELYLSYNNLSPKDKILNQLSENADVFIRTRYFFEVGDTPFFVDFSLLANLATQTLGIIQKEISGTTLQ